MSGDELAAVIAAATALLRSRDKPAAPARSAWKIAARIGATDAAHARAASTSASLWRLRERSRA